MDGSRLVKLCKDCGLIDKQLNQNDIDIIFAKVKRKGHRKIEWEQFVYALDEIGLKKDSSLENIVLQIINCPGPIAQGTKALYNKLHDDKTMYTGVYGRGGPTNYDPDANVQFVKGLQKSIPFGSLALTPQSKQTLKQTLIISKRENGFGDSMSTLRSGENRMSINSSQSQSSLKRVTPNSANRNSQDLPKNVDFQRKSVTPKANLTFRNSY